MYDFKFIYNALDLNKLLNIYDLFICKIWIGYIEFVLWMR